MIKGKNIIKRMNLKEFNSYENLKLDSERALYSVNKAYIAKCVFDGPNDGESALKESKNVYIIDCDFRLRYPFWHVFNAKILNSKMTDTCRAPLWYGKQILIDNCIIKGIKAVRECEDISLNNCEINSNEFGWFTNKITIKYSRINSEYPFLNSLNLFMDNIELNGKYSFQYTKNVEIYNSVLNTKDAFWHCKDVVVRDSILHGEYLGWYSENLKLINCKIISRQPLCYAKNLIVENCEMIECELAFENSDVNAVISGEIKSVKNPHSGYIYADSIAELIIDENQSVDASCIVETKQD